jgi:hypothetical protein
VSKVYDLTRPLGLRQTMPEAGSSTPLAGSLAGYTFLDCLERSPLGETWKVRGPDGRGRVAFYLRGGEGREADWRLERLRWLGHPTLPGFEIVETGPGRTVLLTEGCDKTLQERFQECRLRGLPGIPRDELLAYLRTAAEALDAVYLENGFQHLALTPRSLWLEEGRVRVGGFGLIQLFWLPTGQLVERVNPRYCTPELAHGVSRACDQYSLALIFAELLTGVHPLYGPASRRRRPGRGRGGPALNLLSSADQELIARGLRRRPSQRFRRSADLVKALAEVPAASVLDPSGVPGLLPPLIAAGSPKLLTPARTLPCTSLNQFITELVALAAGPARLECHHSIRYRLEPGQKLEHRCTVDMYPGAALLKLEGFRQYWHAQTQHLRPGLFALTVNTLPSFWERLTGHSVGLETQVQLMPTRRDPTRHTEVTVLIRPFGCTGARAVRLLAELGPVLLESVRTYLQVCPEQRAQERLVFNRPVRVSPVRADLQVADPIDCVAKDVSARGIGLFLPQRLCTDQVYITLPELPQVALVAGLAQVVRGQACGDGWYEVGAFFATDGPRSARQAPYGAGWRDP